MPEYLKEMNKIMAAFHSGNLTMGEFKSKIGKLWREQTEQMHLNPQNQGQEKSPSQKPFVRKNRKKGTTRDGVNAK
jgi:hypothetical protein